ncbi:MAG TPA: TIGR04290 family methyltransferase [Vicinamibacterales bacterium]
MEEIASAVERLGPWFHNLRLDGVETAPRHFLGDYPATFFARFAHAIPRDLRGWTVLDVGCNGGFYSIEMKRRGAARVLGIDAEPLYVRQARYAADRLGVDVEVQTRSVFDVHRLGGPFDLVLFMGVLYHLRYPLLALDLLRRYAVGRLLVFQSMQRGSPEVTPVAPDYAFEDRSPFEAAGYPRLHFVEGAYAHDRSNWWIPNRACVEAMLRSAGFRICSHPDPEVYICEPDPDAELPVLPDPYREERARA